MVGCGSDDSDGDNGTNGTNGIDETVYVYFDNPAAIDQQSPHTVFGTEHEGVWHLGG